MNKEIRDVYIDVSEGDNVGIEIRAINSLKMLTECVIYELRVDKTLRDQNSSWVNNVRFVLPFRNLLNKIFRRKKKLLYVLYKEITAGYFRVYDFTKELTGFK